MKGGSKLFYYISRTKLHNTKNNFTVEVREIHWNFRVTDSRCTTVLHGCISSAHLSGGLRLWAADTCSAMFTSTIWIGYRGSGQPGGLSNPRIKSASYAVLSRERLVWVKHLQNGWLACVNHCCDTHPARAETQNTPRENFQEFLQTYKINISIHGRGKVHLQFHALLI